MKSDKRKRVFIEPAIYAELIKIGQGAGDSTECALSGIEKAVRHFNATESIDIEMCRKFEKFKDLDETILNNLEVLFMLGKNAKIPKDELNGKINEALKSKITETLGA